MIQWILYFFLEELDYILFNVKFIFYYFMICKIKEYKKGRIQIFFIEKSLHIYM